MPGPSQNYYSWVWNPQIIKKKQRKCVFRRTWCVAFSNYAVSELQGQIEMVQESNVDMLCWPGWQGLQWDTWGCLGRAGSPWGHRGLAHSVQFAPGFPNHGQAGSSLGRGCLAHNPLNLSLFFWKGSRCINFKLLKCCNLETKPRLEPPMPTQKRRLRRPSPCAHSF